MLMTRSRLLIAAIAATGAAALSGCATYDPYGRSYSGVSIGVGTGGYYGGYGGYGGYSDYGYGGYGGGYGYGYPSYGYASPYGGWYNNYYYPGTGVYVYDRNRRSYRMSDAQRRYWQQQRVTRQRNPQIIQNRREYRVERRDDRRDYRVERRDDRRALEGGQVTREQYRADRQQDRRVYRQDRLQDRRELRRENRRDRGPN
jgi:hypothetical protein